MQNDMTVTGSPFYMLVNPKLENLEGLIWEPWQDLALVLCLTGETEDGKTFWVKLPAGTKGIEKISIEDVKAAARESLAETSQIRSLGEAIAEIAEELEVEELEMYEEVVDLLVVTIRDQKFGAAAITLPEIQEELTRRLGDFYIIPSSKHEVLCFPAEGLDPSGLNNMIMEVNIAETKVDEWLGDHAYICRGGVISSVGRGEGA